MIFNDIPVTHVQYLSLLLGIDPLAYIHGEDRFEWIQRLIVISVPLVTTISRVLT